jgi:hypothetical protein
MTSFEPEAVFGAGENAAMFGRCTYPSTVRSKLVITPFAVFARVKDRRCYRLEFMEDTLAMSAWFRSGHRRSAAIPTAARSPSDGCVNGHTIDSGAL